MRALVVCTFLLMHAGGVFFTQTDMAISKTQHVIVTDGIRGKKIRLSIFASATAINFTVPLRVILLRISNISRDSLFPREAREKEFGCLNRFPHVRMNTR